MRIPWKTLCGTAITIAAMVMGYDSQLAFIAVCALLGIEAYNLKRKE